MSEYMDYNEWLEIEVKRLETQCGYINRNYKLILDDKINLIMKETEYKDKIRDLNKENTQLKERISNLVTENTKLQNDLFSEQLDQDETEDYIEELKEDNKILIELKNIWLDSHRKLAQERDKLSDELTSKIRHNHYQTLEINELKRELKEYRGF